mgnify:CR=1 FL=1
MKFRSYDSLRIFDAVARTQSMTIASQDLNLSKGSISYQINKLEMELGFVLFDRLNARLQLTDAGLRLWHASHNALTQIDREIDDLRGTKLGSLSIGALTYFSSRWLSPKLMTFFEKNPGVNLRIDSINSIDDPKIKEVDLAILWGFEEWKGYDSRLLINLPAVPIGNPSLANKVESLGVSNALKTGKTVEIRGLGRWYYKKLKENFNARNPATNELIYKPERMKVRFKSSKNLMKIINE